MYESCGRAVSLLLVYRLKKEQPKNKNNNDKKNQKPKNRPRSSVMRASATGSMPFSTTFYKGRRKLSALSADLLSHQLKDLHFICISVVLVMYSSPKPSALRSKCTKGLRQSFCLGYSTIVWLVHFWVGFAPLLHLPALCSQRSSA